jgi:opacity protein-like surface antigen/outer membrane protease
MKRFLLEGVAVSALLAIWAGGFAKAADMPVKALPVDVPVKAPVDASWSWTGLYAGGDIGGAWGLSHFPDPFGPSMFGDTAITPGFNIGGDVGYNYQIGSLVLGVEGALNWAGVDGTNTCFAFSQNFISANCRSQTNLLGSITGRAGFADGHTLYYAKGGIAGAHNMFEVNTGSNGVNLDNPIVRTATTPVGWRAGAGIEYAFTPRWSVKLEYDYYHFNNSNVGTTFGFSVGVPQELHQVLLGVNRKFGDYDAPWPSLRTVPSSWPAVMPLKAAPPPLLLPEWNLELATRYWYSSGKAKEDLYNTLDTNLLSRLTYDRITSGSPEIYGRLDMPTGVFLKGFMGLGTIDHGKLNDEDWGGPTYSNTISQLHGHIDYATVDVGHDLISDPRYRIGAFLGYNYFEETIPTIGCVQIANPASGNCVGNFTVDSPITEYDRWQSIRAGVAAEFMPFDRVKVSVDAAYLPYVRFDETDNHWFRGLIFPGWGSGSGFQLEALISYLVTDQFSVGIGGRYWSMGTPRESTASGIFAPGVGGVAVGPNEGYRFDVERYGLFAQGAYHFGPTGNALGVEHANYAAPARNWTGFYAGLSFGARANDATAAATCVETPCSAGAPFIDTVPGIFDSQSPRLGIYAGYNWHILPRYVLGIEGDIAWARSNRTVDDFWANFAANPPGDPATITEGADGSIRGRIGYLINPRLMLYTTAGATWQQERFGINCFDGNFDWCTQGSKSETANALRFGYTVGGGVEWALWRNWVSRIEYRFADYGRLSHTFFASFPQDSITETERLKTHTALAGVAYQFGSYPDDPPFAVNIHAASPVYAKAPPVGGPSGGWTGAYLGASVGGRWADTVWTTTGIGDPLARPDPTHNGVSYASATPRAGGYFGYNWQFAQQWVVGTEGDAAWGSSTNTQRGIPGTFGTGGQGVGPGAVTTDQSSVTEGWDASYRIRFGFLPTPGWLLYATAGAAWQNVQINARCNGTPTNASWCFDVRNETYVWAKPGWTVGGGIEAKLWGNLLSRVEYRYADYGSFGQIFFAGGPGENVAMKEHLSTQTVLLGLAYRFAGPLLAIF